LLELNVIPQNNYDFQKQHSQCFRGFHKNVCGANCGANAKSSYKKVFENLLVTA
jgi:hypothetical protein